MPGVAGRFGMLTFAGAAFFGFALAGAAASALRDTGFGFSIRGVALAGAGAASAGRGAGETAGGAVRLSGT